MRDFTWKGVGYDAGVDYAADFLSRPVWRPDDVRRDLRAIREDLGANAVLIMATDLDRLAEAGAMARELGLEVWLQPRLFEARPDAVVANLAEAAGRAEDLRAAYGGVSLNVGCELTLTASGLMPGPNFAVRGMLLPWLAPILPLANLRLRRLLGALARVARERFSGRISYGAGDWERPDWSIFDVVGLDLYRTAANAWRFAGDVRARVARGKPVIVFEFGCCAYPGAAENSSQAYGVLRWRGGEGRVPARLKRDESVQARYLEELFDIFAEAGVDGVFVWAFSEPVLTRSDQPGRDLDLAGYGLVAVEPGDGPERWTPKQAFHTVAARYGATS
ncbi:hypothetical protein [Nonomuraea sp. NPDC048826]|uniref:hypothetical protein n=1 Tax=Nonomuraea sp. NPDC048826 TaxID=3364347 RepID=UPI0037132009